MVAVMLNLRILIYGWIATNIGLLISSGYLKKLALALSMKNMKEFIDVHTVIFPFQSINIKYYDITEFIVSYLIAVFFFFVIKKIEQGRINYKVYQTF